MAEHIYKPGESVPRSGLYLVTHKQHRTQHEATLFQGEQFPACGTCGEDVAFQLSRPAVPISEDADFKPKNMRPHPRGHR